MVILIKWYFLIIYNIHINLLLGFIYNYTYIGTTILILFRGEICIDLGDIALLCFEFTRYFDLCVGECIGEVALLKGLNLV